MIADALRRERFEALPFKGRVGWGWVGGLRMEGQNDRNILASKLQRTLRRRMTDAERTLWSILRNRQIEGCKFRRQHPYDRYILDFVCLEHRLVIEVDGGQHCDSGSDAVRDAFLRAAGFTVLRFWNHDVLSETFAVGDAIMRVAADLKKTHPHPGPPLEGEGENAGLSTSCRLLPLAADGGGSNSES